MVMLIEDAEAEVARRELKRSADKPIRLGSYLSAAERRRKQLTFLVMVLLWISGAAVGVAMTAFYLIQHDVFQQEGVWKFVPGWHIAIRWSSVVAVFAATYVLGRNVDDT